MNQNLDLIAAKTAQMVIKHTKEQKREASDVENLATKTLGILQENGVYAALLYLYSRSAAKERPIAIQIRTYLYHLISSFSGRALALPKDIQDTFDDVQADTALEFLTTNICDDIDKLLFVKRLWEQTLIYVRYGAKAWGAETSAKPKGSDEGTKVAKP
jgi:hypothetical protein